MPSESPDPQSGARGTRVSRRAALGALAAVGSLAVAGCSSFPSSGGVDPTWRRDISAASAAGPPAVVDDLVLVGAQDKVLHGFRATDGESEFAVETGGPIEARPAVPERGGPYHVHSTDGDVYAVGPGGETRWHREGVRERGTLARSGSLLVQLDPYGDDETLRGFDAATGDRRFERAINGYRLDGLTEDLLAVQTPASGGRTRVTALSPSDGSVRWRTDAGSSYPTVAADEDLVVAARATDTDRDRTVVTAREPADGTERWRTPVDAADLYRLPRLGPQVYFGGRGSDAAVVALDRRSGDVAWRATAGYQVERIASTEEAVFVGSEVDDPDGGILARVDCFGLDGTRRWKTVTDAPSVEDLVVSGDLVVVCSDRELVGIERDTGATRWGYEPESYSRLDVAAADESLYVSYRDQGTVAAFPTV